MAEKRKKISKEDKVKISNEINYYRTLPKNVRDSAGFLKPKEEAKVHRCPNCDCVVYINSNSKP